MDGIAEYQFGTSHDGSHAFDIAGPGGQGEHNHQHAGYVGPELWGNVVSVGVKLQTKGLNRKQPSHILAVGLGYRVSNIKDHRSNRSKIH